MIRGGSLRGRLLRRLAVLLGGIMLVSAWSAYWSARQAADTAYDRTLLASARAVADGLYADGGKLKASVPYVALDTFAYDSAGRIYYQVIDPQGQQLSGYEDLPPTPPGTPRTNDYPALAHFYDALYRGQGVRVVSLLQPISEPQISGIAEIRVAETQGARERMARELLVGTLWRMGLLSVSALLLVWVAINLALRPLEPLRRAVAERASDDLRPLPDAGMPREVMPLVEALNQFNERLRGLFERQSAFIADAAHELRTPLAALKARIALGLRAQQAEDWRATLEQAAEQSDRLTQLANQLLSLARIESGARAIAEGGAQHIDLSQLARELGMALAPLAHAQGVALALEAEESVWVDGEPMLLNELLNNLIDNALAHTPVGGNLVLRVLAPAVLEVEDDGPGIPSEEHDKVFERFYRRGAQGGGAGLGLAIVGEICRAHQARISLHQVVPHGLRVRVEFPPSSGAES
ncbi:sensor histidine kinase [Pseudomonas sp. GOM7]|uniref:sensor histidine kinase n=1 Tax=unclassified Pseudomonas TaxID=196821 RepID=UPI00227C17A1|nr:MULTISPECIES: sensor histidine kinase [unclassified Pseudomonas]WAJ39344.1 sensor histidine kinase [Pseudomonas sp. GOM7]